MSQGDTPSTLKLCFLGPPQMERDGRPVRVDTRKAVALAAYLAVTARAHSRDALAALLWPEYEPTRAYANLRRTLWALGKAIGKEWLEAEADIISLRRDDGYWLDIDEFRAHLAACAHHEHSAAEACPECTASLSAAVALYRDDFLAGFSLRDSAAFDDWQFFEAEGLRQELASALERLVQCAIEQGRYEAAIPHARRWLALDPLHEPAHRSLMQLYALSGQRSAALRQYRECALQLEDELGAAPDARTEALRQAIETRQFPPPQVQTVRPEEVAPVAVMPAGSGPPAPGTPPHNLPAPLTPFVGRESELAEIGSLLEKPDCRLLSLVGPGGIGKTRLAVEAARQALGRASRRYPHGVYFVPLAGLELPTHVTPAIAEAVGFAFYEREGHPPEAQLLDYLAGKRMLLILDNLEHLLVSPDEQELHDPAGQAPTGIRLLAELLPTAPQLTVLTTSRERLNLQGEWVLSVGGMPYPKAGHRLRPDDEQLSAYDALDLFVQRARMTAAGFQPTVEEVGHLVRICQLVEGWPLGIELAAAWVRALPLAQIEREIESGLDFLSTSLRDVPARHRSLRAVCDHSWRLLSAQEQAIFRRLAVFRGGFRLEAARAVAGASLPLLRALVDKSLLHRISGPEERYFLHQVLNQYASARLDEAPGEREETRDRHCAFYTGFLADQTEDLKGRRQAEALDQIAAEVENVRAAWTWASDHCRVQDLHRSAEALFQFWLVRRGFAEGERAFGRAAEHLASSPCVAACESAGLSRERALILGLTLSFQGHLAQYSVSRPAAMRILERSLEVLRPLGRSRELALANLYAAFWSEQDEYGGIETMLRESLAIFEEAGDRWGVARCLYELSYDPLASREVILRALQQSLAVSEEVGDWWGVAMCHFALGEHAHMTGDFDQALRQYGLCLEIRRQIDDRMGLGTVLDYMGYVEREMGHYPAARRLHQESLALSQEIGDRLGIGGSLDNLGLVARDEGLYEEAERLLLEGLAHRRALSTGWEESISMEHLGSVALAQGELVKAKERYRASLKVAQDLTWNQGTALALAGLSRVLVAQGREEAACKHAASAMLLAGMISNLVVALDLLLAAGQVLHTLGDLQLAAELLAHVAQHPAGKACTRAAAERSLEEITRMLGSENVEQARQRAGARTLEQAAEEGQAALSSGGADLNGA